MAETSKDGPSKWKDLIGRQVSVYLNDREETQIDGLFTGYSDKGDAIFLFSESRGVSYSTTVLVHSMTHLETRIEASN